MCQLIYKDGRVRIKPKSKVNAKEAILKIKKWQWNSHIAGSMKSWKKLGFTYMTIKISHQN